MNTKSWAAATAVAGLMVGLAGAARAAQQTAFAIQGGNDTAANVFYTPGPAGGMTISGPNEFVLGKLGQGFDGSATITFTNMANGSYSKSASGAFDQVLNPGSTISSFVLTDNATHTVLLSGTLGTANLTGFNGSSSGNVNLASNDVTYTGGTFFPTGFSPTGGALSVEFTSTSPFSASATGLGAFTGVDGITFSGVNLRGPGGGGNGVPEPASMASMSVGALFLLGALLRKRRGSRSLAF
jgi:hypothetical protein